MKKIGLIASFVAFLVAGASAQEATPAVSTPLPGGAGEPVEGYYRSHMQLPAEIRTLLDNNKVKEAVAEYEKLKKTLKVDPLDRCFWELEVYGTASFIDPVAGYGRMREDVLEKMIKDYPDNAEILMYAIPADGNTDKTLEVLSKAIEVDSMYLPAYEQRFYIYREKGMMKEACLDYMRLPESVKARMGMEVECKTFAEEAENK